MGQPVNPALDNLAPIFHPLVTDETVRYFLLTGGRGGAKSFNTSTWANLLTYGHHHRILFTRFTMTSAEISIIPEFTEKIDLLGVEEHFTVKRKEIENRLTGSDIIFRGIKVSGKNQTGKLKSIQGVTTWINDETEELVDEDIFDTIDLSIRTNKRRNRIVLVMNPTDQNHWVYKRWIERSHRTELHGGYPVQISTHPEVCHIHTTYLDNAHLDALYVANARKLERDNNEKYRYKMIGQWRKQAEGVVFPNWREGAFDESLPYVHGMDYGFFPDPQAVGQVAVNEPKKLIHVRQKIYATELSDEQIETGLEAAIPDKRRDLIIADTSEPRTTRKLRRRGFNIVEARKGPGSVVAGIRKMQEYTIVVEPGSYDYMRELNTYVWNDKRASIPVDDNNHLLDLTRYCVERLTRKGGMNAL